MDKAMQLNIIVLNIRACQLGSIYQPASGLDTSIHPVIFIPAIMVFYHMYINIYTPQKKLRILFFWGYFLLNCYDKSRIIKYTPKKKKSLTFFGECI